MFTPGAAFIVQGVTKPEENGLDKRSREYSVKVVEKVKQFGQDCVELKCDADRLHNMITLWGSIEKKKYKIWETEQYFLPMAKEFGFESAELRRAIKYQRNLLQIDVDMYSR
jgi:(p)ppGpp synthase/HD superfamily hydrolase